MTKFVSSFLFLVISGFGFCDSECQKIEVDNCPFAFPGIRRHVFPSRKFVISDFGARADGSNCSKAIAQAIDTCSSAGGGRVVIPKGVWFTGPIRLKSHIELYLSEGAVLDFSDNPNDYLPSVRSGFEGIECWTRSPLVYAYECVNVAITGPGMLRPRLGAWMKWGGSRLDNALSRRSTDILAHWGEEGVPVDQRKWEDTPFARMRPQTIQFNRCKSVTLRDFCIKGTPWWTIHLYRTESVYVCGLTVCAHSDDRHETDYAEMNYLNNSDGIDIEMSKNVLVERCSFCQGDDAIVIKAGRGRDGWERGVPSENIVVRKCLVRRAHSLVSIGSELSAGVRNVFVEDCELRGLTFNAFFVKTTQTRGGFVENVWIRRIKAKTVTESVIGIVSDYPNAAYNIEAPTKTRIRNVNCSDIQVDVARDGIRICGSENEPVRDVCVSNLTIGCLSGRLAITRNAENAKFDGLCVMKDTPTPVTSRNL